MKKHKKLILMLVIIGIVGLAGIAYAASETKTPAEIASSLTGKSVDDLYKERTAGKTYGTIAKEAGKLDEFKSEMLKQKKIILDKRVKDGELTQKQSDRIYDTIKENQVNCDGTGRSGAGRNYGIGFGRGQVKGMSKGRGRGKGAGCGMGKLN